MQDTNQSTDQIDQENLILLAAFHPSQDVRRAANELNWRLIEYRRSTRRKDTNATN